MTWTESVHGKNLTSSSRRSLSTRQKSQNSARLVLRKLHKAAGPIVKNPHLPWLAALAVLSVAAFGFNFYASKKHALQQTAEKLDLIGQTIASGLKATPKSNYSFDQQHNWFSKAVPNSLNQTDFSFFLTDKTGTLTATKTNLPIFAGEDLTTILVSGNASFKGPNPKNHYKQVTGPQNTSFILVIQPIKDTGLLAIMQSEASALATWRKDTFYQSLFVGSFWLIIAAWMTRTFLREKTKNARTAFKAFPDAAEGMLTQNHNQDTLLDAIESISEAFALWDRHKRLVVCNSKFRNFHRLKADRTKPGTHIDEISRWTEDEIVTQGIFADNSIDKSECSYEAKLSNGRWLQINERRTTNGGYVSVGTDITTVKRSQRRLTHRERELKATISDLRKSRSAYEQQAEELVVLADKYMKEKIKAEDANRTKSEFLANISHELRTPLNAIIGFTDVMKQRMFGPLGNKKYHEYARDIHDSGNYLLEMINDILDMSKIEAGGLQLEKENVDIGAVIDNCMKVVRHAAAQKNISLSRQGIQALTVNGDSRALKQVIINLLTNAIKFTPENGNIALRLSRYRGRARIAITDTGIGISKKDVSKLGKPFVQLENQLTKTQKGSGLGLAISKSLIEMHDGDLSIKSRQGDGTTVTFRLPIDQTNKTAPNAQNHAQAERDLQSQLSLPHSEKEQPHPSLYGTA